MKVLRIAILFGVSLATAAGAWAQNPATPLYRVFLSDGSAVASFGEWARVGDRVVFSMPLAPAAGAGDLHLVSLPVQRIDLDRTERYAEAVRASQYAATRGEADFAQLSAGVAHTLNQVALLTEPKQRLATAEQARHTLAAWPGAHLGYRATEVREILGVLDDVIAGLRAQSGQRGFDIALSANTLAPPTEPLLPAPDHTEVIQGLLTASRLVESPAERMSLLQSVVTFIDRAIDYLPASVAATLRSMALGDIAEEKRVSSLYESLRAMTLADAARFAERADVRGLELLRERVRAHDLKLGGRRPDDVAGVLATLDVHLDAAHRLRLAQDQWLLAESRMNDYRRAIAPYVQALLDHRESFDDIKLLAGPAPQRLLPLARELNRHARFVALIQPPQQLVNVHSAMRSAFSLAENAVQLRRDAVEAADVELARRASSAAAGALMLLERARADLKAALEPPVKIASRP
jgi:hypothetical protein